MDDILDVLEEAIERSTIEREENKRKVIEFLEQRLKNLKYLAKEDNILFPGKRSHVSEAVERMIIIIQKTLINYHRVKENEPWLINEQCITSAQLSTFIETAEERIKAFSAE